MKSLLSLLAAYTPAEIEHQLADNGLRCLTVEIPSDRHWVAWGSMAEDIDQHAG